MRSRKNTAAASVEPTMAPSSSAPIGSRSSTAQPAKPDTAAVISTPAVARISEGARMPRNAESRVRSPPSNRMTDSAIEPTR